MNAQITNIWKDHYDQLLNFIRKRVKDKEVANDILQDVFLKILTKIDTLKSQEKLKSWLFQISRNVIADYYRQQQKENKLIEQKPETDFEEDLDAMSEAESWIGLYISDLPENYRQAVVLSEIEGLPIKQVAEQLGISYSNANARVNRGRNALKKSLTDCCTFHVDVYGKVLDYHRNTSDCKNC